MSDLREFHKVPFPVIKGLNTYTNWLPEIFTREKYQNVVSTVPDKVTWYNREYVK